MCGLVSAVEAMRSRAVTYGPGRRSCRTRWGTNLIVHRIRQQKAFSSSPFTQDQLETSEEEKLKPDQLETSEEEKWKARFENSVEELGATTYRPQDLGTPRQPPPRLPRLAQPLPQLDHTDGHFPILYGRNRRSHRIKEKRGYIKNVVPGIENYNLRSVEREHPWETSKSPRKALLDALRIGTHHSVLRCLIRLVMAGTERFAFLTEIPSTTFSEILKSLDPHYFLDEYQRRYKTIIKPRHMEILSLTQRGFDSYHKFASLFLSEMTPIIRARRAIGPLTLTDYSYLLKCARATGRLHEANAIWREMKNGKIKPDLDCYNSYMGVLCWSETSNIGQYTSLRVIPRNFAPRRWDLPPEDLQGHRVGIGGIKQKIVELFQEMVTYGLAGDERTFCCMMIGFARERDLSNVGTLLKRVWDIDVDAVVASQGYERPARRYEANSPFYPTNQLLYTIAHVYAINHHIATALRLIDYISRQYSIDIEHNVWTELMNWTYTLAVPRTWKYVERLKFEEPDDEGLYQTGISDASVSDNTGNLTLPAYSVVNLWNTLIAEPYNVKPSVELVNLPILRMIRNMSAVRALDMMEVGRYYFKEEVSQLNSLQAEIKSLMMKDSKHPALEDMIQTLHLSQLKVRHNRALIRNWVRKILTMKFDGYPPGHWAEIHMPRMIRDWDIFLDKWVTITTETGVMNLRTHSLELNRLRAWRFRYGNKEAKLHRMARRGEPRRVVADRRNLVRHVDAVHSRGKKVSWSKRYKKTPFFAGAIVSTRGKGASTGGRSLAQEEASNRPVTLADML
ncbi:hypothetical protein GLAREA_06567 [Glarea lozoyensis ATCC 20868]|uniref:Pentatricopeptide repeat-containing protein n=1 Tax=Glarea lozoyensis (strain ATCC 20868 / MF5171) TaxID=1116229 RepID=S3D8S9_GLAL2|nr:uncharacterized protein GLAREA_06567 [Glarea lozoyensis ATCC 20868]EPE33554.1 hypothetical protein GLAREA_06567 [Glarea lozoyensis ATCC 20868]